MNENEEKKIEEAKKAEKVTLVDFKKHIKDTKLKLVPLKGTNAVKFDKNICYVRDTNYGISVWVSVGKDANKTKQIKTEEQLCNFVNNLKSYVEKVSKEN